MHGPKLQYSNTDLKCLFVFGIWVHTTSVTESHFKILIVGHSGLSLHLHTSSYFGPYLEIRNCSKGTDSNCLSFIINIFVLYVL